MSILLEKLKAYLPYVIGLLIMSCIVFYPELQGKKLGAHDSISNICATAENKIYEEKGETILWTNRIFGGMPTFTTGGIPSGNFLTMLHYMPVKSNIYIYFICLLSIFFALSLLKIDKTIAFVLSVAFGLNVWVLDSLWAFHVTKIMTYAALSIVVAAFISYMLYGGLIRLISIGIGLTLCIGANHVQVTYYGAILCTIIGIYFFIDAIKTGAVAAFFKKIGLILCLVCLSVISNISLLYFLEDYNKDTMRGGKSEITKAGANSTSEKGGLDINYAYSWSYNTEELFNFFIPDAVGGASTYKVNPKKSKLAEAIQQDKIPMYWGGQPFTGGPNYLGVAIFFLSIFAMFYWKNNLKYALIIAFFLSMFMGLGKYFLSFNQILFDHLPLYNKFRTPTMSFSILNIVVILLSAMSLNSFFKSDDDKDEKMKALKKTAYTALGLLIIGYIYVSNGGYTSTGDSQTFANNKDALNLIIEDRTSFFKFDWIRSFIILGILAGGFYYYIKDSISKKNLLILISVITIFEMWNVATRYLDSEAFQKIENKDDLVPNYPYNASIEQDKSYFRIFNTANQGVFNDNTDGFRFNNVGGYSPAKLYRYQDLIDVHLSKGNMPVLNMLNTKYFIVDNGGQQGVQTNPNACGNAWFIHNVRFAKNANEEMDSIGTFDPKQTVWIDKRFENFTNYAVNSDPNASISLTKYHPENMEYQSNSSTGGFVVFSEIWYRGNEDWNLYVNGKPEKLVRVNYLLRGAHIPAGNNKVEMKFKVKKLDFYKTLSFASTLIQVILLLGVIIFYYRKKDTE